MRPTTYRRSASSRPRWRLLAIAVALAAGLTPAVSAEEHDDDTTLTPAAAPGTPAPIRQLPHSKQPGPNVA